LKSPTRADGATRLGDAPLRAQPQEGTLALGPKELDSKRSRGEGSAAEGPRLSPTKAAIEIPLTASHRWEITDLVAAFTRNGLPSLAHALRQGEPYLPMIREILTAEDLPADLAYLPLVESRYRHDAQSPAGAVGLWQFMAGTARASGLRVDRWVDERLDPERSTRAAARHLKALQRRFKDWDLALAAYNAGVRRVATALERSDEKHFWAPSLTRHLPRETRRYVPKFHAIVFVVENSEGYGLTVERGGTWSPPETVSAPSLLTLATAAHLSGVSEEVLRKLNPALRWACTPPGTDRYPLRLPRTAARHLEQALVETLWTASADFHRHIVRRGETLSSIAQRYGVTHPLIAEFNAIASPRRLRPGRELIVPLRSSGLGSRPCEERSIGNDERRARSIHVVRRGDTIWRISEQYGVSVEKIVRWNRLESPDRIFPGGRILVGPERT
jgi:membrane-bound lytic murein transglycosylase D